MALATIVGVKGSTYRREGARLLVPENGKPVGTISGGCLEGDVREAAKEVMATSSWNLPKGPSGRLELSAVRWNRAGGWHWPRSSGRESPRISGPVRGW